MENIAGFEEYAYHLIGRLKQIAYYSFFLGLIALGWVGLFDSEELTRFIDPELSTLGFRAFLFLGMFLFFITTVLLWLSLSNRFLKWNYGVYMGHKNKVLSTNVDQGND